MSSIEPIDVSHWMVSQVIAHDYYDGPRSGWCRLVHPKLEFQFELLDEWDGPLGWERLFAIRTLPDGSVARIATPASATAPNPDSREVELAQLAEWSPIVLHCNDFGRFLGGWIVPLDARVGVTDWFARLGIDRSAIELDGRLREFRDWAATADRREDGWPSDCPIWPQLMNVSKAVMRKWPLTEQMIALLGQAWAAAHESEELLEDALASVDAHWNVRCALTKHPEWECRWQAYVAAAAAGTKAEPLLREGLNDAAEYVRRRALLALAALAPADAEALAAARIDDPEPYIRQAAIEMVMATQDDAFRWRALSTLVGDPVAHVRAAAEKALSRLK